MKKLMTLALVLFVGLGVQAQTGAKIAFKSEVVDYGEIAKGADGLRSFEFTNTGNEPLVISRVDSSCGCTIPEKPEGPIAPGQTGVIKVKYDTMRVGPIRKTITVYSNDMENPTMPLKIKGTILDPSSPGKSVLEKTEIDK